MTPTNKLFSEECITLLPRGLADVTSAILPTRNVDLTSLPNARIVLILKAELFLRTTPRGRTKILIGRPRTSADNR